MFEIEILGQALALEAIKVYTKLYDTIKDDSSISYGFKMNTLNTLEKLSKKFQ